MAFFLRIKIWLLSITQKEEDSSHIYVDLAPTDKADESKIYSGALTYATRNSNVSNIALTGPYGSGKSSIIKTFLTIYKRPVLEISLAAFLPEADGSVTTNDTDSPLPKGKVSKQEIERSILQQMLYGADANSLPLSRFKRIQSPKWWSAFISLFIVLGLMACVYLVHNKAAIFSGAFFKPQDFTNWFNFASVIIGFLFLWRLLHFVYIKSFGVSLTNISLKNIEIKPEASEEESILNRHLDEIIYFFQSTKYDLVVIEDLDRFNNPDIFVTLREINSLINANAGVKRPIRFLYALRDNMFVNTDRTKFFEFIIPVIPIINSSNSIDKVIEQGERLSLDERLDRQFLREVSRYLNDLRLIQNIFNEYAIYVKNLETDDENILDTNKLLAILIYKNVLPSDFEELHREKGKLAEILNRHDTYIANAETQYKNEISELEQKISKTEKQVPSNLEELRKIYAMVLIDRIPQNFTSIFFDNRSIPIKAISSHEAFEQLINQTQIQCRNQQNQIQNVDIGSFQDDVDIDKTYQDRKEEIEYRSDEFKNSTAKTIRELRSKILTLRTAKFHEIIRTNAENTEELFDAFGESRELIRFLVFEGFLDDSYYQYISLFHSGRLSPNDNKYLIQIRSFNNPEPDFQIDNPKEVIAAMREDDFRQEFVLNKTLVDCMFSNQVDYGPQIAKLIGFVSSNFTTCDAFLSTYYESGKCVSELLSALIDKWPNFVSAVIASTNNITHVARMIAHLPDNHLKKIHKNDHEIFEFLSMNLSKILALEIDFDPVRLTSLQFEVKDLASIAPYPAITRLLSEKGLYEISTENLEFIFRNVLESMAIEDLRTKHYSTILNSEEEAVLYKVHSDFELYLKDVLLQSDNNSEEEVSAILKVLEHDEIDHEYLEQFIEQQTTKLPLFDQIPERFHSYVFHAQKIEPTWDNCIAYRNCEDCDADTLTAFLVDSEVLSTTTIDDTKTAILLRQFLLNNNDFDADVYQTYIRTLPRQFTQFPTEIDIEKLRILITEEKITFSSASFSFLGEYEELQVLFVAKNIEAYFENSDEYEIDDDFREQLLVSDIGDKHKLSIINEVDLTLIPSSPSLASTVGQILHRTNAVIDMSAEAVQAIIINSRPIATQISLFNRYQKMLSNEQIWSTIHQLPSPFSGIKRSWRQPTIPNTVENGELVKWLESRSIISSSKLTYLDGEIRIYNKRK